MLSLLLPLWMLAVAVGGVRRLVQPRRYFRGEMADAKKIRLNGLLRLAFGSAMVWMMGLSFSFSPAPVNAGANDPLERLVREKCSAFLKKRDTAGLSVAVIAGEKENVFHFGRAALGTARPVNNETLFEIGSITKVFTGVALARHVEDGRLKLDEKITTLLPAGLEQDDAAREITLQHLTTHTSGYSRMPGAPQILPLANFLLFGGDPYSGLTLDIFKSKLAKAKPETKPGETMSYSNFGVSLLGWLLAQKAGLDYDAMIRKEVLEPLGMNSTWAGPAPKLAQGYRGVFRLGPLAFGLRSAEWPLPDHLTAAGGLRSTAGDMLKFLRANMRPDDSAIGRALQRSHTELFKASDTRSVGMNWIRSRRDKDAPTVIWHNGGTGGFRSYMGFYEDGAAGVVILSNGPRDADSLGAELLKELAALPK